MSIDKPTDQLQHMEKKRKEGWLKKFGLLGAQTHRLEFPRGFPLGLSWRWIQIPSAHWTTYSGQFRAEPGILPLPAPAASRALLHHLCLPRLSITGQKESVRLDSQTVHWKREGKKQTNLIGAWGLEIETKNGWFFFSTENI